MSRWKPSRTNEVYCSNCKEWYDESVDEICKIIVENCKKINITAEDSAIRAMGP